MRKIIVISLLVLAQAASQIVCFPMDQIWVGGAALAQSLGGMSGVSNIQGGSSTPLVVCTNQLVLIYSNSCALIGQGFGQ